ncbi:MAG: hypothetical protein LBB86_04010, partial [Oscillospiraceae bacterium]|nr:hypothetical protein [Oscillospiraceae bacterium]
RNRVGSVRWILHNGASSPASLTYYHYFHIMVCITALRVRERLSLFESLIHAPAAPKYERLCIIHTAIQNVSKARKNLDPAFIKNSMQSVVSAASSCEDLKLYAGKYRLRAIDGSGVSVKRSLASAFGKNDGKATALASLAYDPLNNIVMDGSLNKHEGESWKNLG